MPTGLKVPVGVDKSGGAKIETDIVEQTKKLLVLAFSEGGDDNAFQNLGIGPGLIFSVKNASFRGKAERTVRLVLKKFIDRVALVPGDEITFDDSEEGEVELRFRYVDLQTGTTEEFIKRFVR